MIAADYFLVPVVKTVKLFVAGYGLHKPKKWFHTSVAFHKSITPLTTYIKIL